MLLGVSRKLCCDFLILSVVIDLEGLTLLGVNPVLDPSPESSSVHKLKILLGLPCNHFTRVSPQKSYTYLLLFPSQLQPSFFVTFITHE